MAGAEQRVRVSYGSAWQGRSAHHEPRAIVYRIQVHRLSSGGRAEESIDVPGVTIAVAPNDPAGTLDSALEAIAQPIVTGWGLALTGDAEVPARAATHRELSIRARGIYSAIPIAAAAA